MRYLFILVLALLIPPSAQAQNVSKSVANSYYNNCLAQEGPVSAQTQELLCACTAAQMQQSMTVEDIKAMNQNNQTGRNALNKMLINVYAPCMEYPAKEHYMNVCLSNPDTQRLSNNPQALCNCMSTEVANYLKANARTVFEEILDRNPNVTDPMQALTNDPQFTQFAQAKLIGCYNQNR